MAMTINTNIDALNTYRNLNNVQSSLSKSLERLSSGLRINQAGDDAAGLTIATKIGSQVSGLQQASRNAQDGVSLLQTADGALGQAQALLGRLRDLAVQSANGTNDDDARAAIKGEADSLVSELNRLGDSVDFNGVKVLNSSSTVTFQVGAGADAASSRIDVNLQAANVKSAATALGATGSSFTVATPTDVAGSQTFSDGTNSYTASLSTTAGTYKTVQSVADALNSDSHFNVGLSASVNANNELVVTSKSGGTVSGGAAGGTAAAPGTGITGTGTAGAPGMNLLTQAGAQNAISAIDAQIQTISGARASIGAAENRFASAISTISTSVQNLTAAKSRITDVDMASEMVNYTRANVLSQSGTAMLAQANSLPQLALKLLG